MSRESINVALALALTQISVANGYALDVMSVEREFRTIDDIEDAQMPILFVEDDGKDTIQYRSVTHDISFPVSVIGFVKRVSGENISTTLNKLDTAVIRAIAADTTLGGTAVEALPAGSTYRSGSRGVDYGAFIRPIEIRYKNTLDAGL